MKKLLPILFAIALGACTQKDDHSSSSLPGGPSDPPPVGGFIDVVPTQVSKDCAHAFFGYDYGFHVRKAPAGGTLKASFSDGTEVSYDGTDFNFGIVFDGCGVVGAGGWKCSAEYLYQWTDGGYYSVYGSASVDPCRGCSE